MLAFDAMRPSDSSTRPTVNQVAVQVTDGTRARGHPQLLPTGS